MKHEFDDFAKEYRTVEDKVLSLTGESSTFFAEYKAQKLSEWLPELSKKSPAKILDFGCGDGLMTHFVHQQFPLAEIHGIDPSSESVAIAQKNYPYLHFGISTETFENDTFDLIYCAGVFHHIPFNLHEQCVKEIYRILKPYGIVVILELNNLNPGTYYIFKNSPHEHNAQMLFPWYTQKLLKPYGSPKLKFYGFFPHFLKKLRGTEKFLTKIPFGGLYASLLTKQPLQK